MEYMTPAQAGRLAREAIAEHDRGILTARPHPGRSTMPITTDQVRQLRDEAGSAGDLEQVRICNEALDGNPGAWHICERVIAQAAAEAAADDDA